jgi:hypothetical protein
VGPDSADRFRIDGDLEPAPVPAELATETLAGAVVPIAAVERRLCDLTFFAFNR